MQISFQFQIILMVLFNEINTYHNIPIFPQYRYLSQESPHPVAILIEGVSQLLNLRFFCLLKLNCTLQVQGRKHKKLTHDNI